MISILDLEQIKARAKALRVEQIVERLPSLAAGQLRALNELPDAKIQLARAFGDADVFVEYLKKVSDGVD